jgi:hypothetical protein
MTDTFNIYCDESCHLEHDRQPVMGLGAVVCPVAYLPIANQAIQALKERHVARGELKWEKVSASRASFYAELIDYFFATPELRFRGWLIENKAVLNHDAFNAGSHDSFYYKMLYFLLDPLIERPHAYNIYLDVKDTRSRTKVRFLTQVLRNSNYDPNGQIITRVQSAPANELQLMQLTDFLLGALCSRNRGVEISSKAKRLCVTIIEEKLGRALVGRTAKRERKFNFFTFTPTPVLLVQQ